jgi:hypothetical protein
MPRPHLTTGKDPVPIVREAGWASGPVRKILPPPGFDLHTVQPVGSRYSDYTTRPIHITVTHPIVYPHIHVL